MGSTRRCGEKELQSARLSQILERTAGAVGLFGTDGPVERGQHEQSTMLGKQGHRGSTKGTGRLMEGGSGVSLRTRIALLCDSGTKQKCFSRNKHAMGRG